jgi:hypothetical protein
VSALAIAGALALSGCQDDANADRVPQLHESPTATATDPDADIIPRSVLLRFDDLQPGQTITKVVNTGELPVRGKIITANGGKLTATPSPYGNGARLPAYASSDPQFAMIGLFNTGDVYLGTDDPLSPGDGDFSFGADFSLDQKTTGSDIDDGDNLIARGIFEAAAQYKIQVDHGLLSCRIAGIQGEVLVKAHRRVTPGEWYRTRCTRRGDTVTLEVAQLVNGEATDWEELEDSGEIGSVVMAQTVPLAVGGKLSGDGTMFPTSTDQFNGSLDRVVYRLLD